MYREVNAGEPPAPFCGGFYFVDENADRAEEMAFRWIGRYYHTAMKHYEMTAEHFGKAKGYEFYSHVGQYIERHGKQGAADDFVRLMPWGTPEQVLEKFAFIRRTIGMKGVMGHFSYAGMPYEEAERNLRCFARHVLPELQGWDAEPLPEPHPLEPPRASA